MYAIPVTPTGFRQPVQEALPRAIQRIVEALHPEKIILFGSYAYGTPTPDSAEITKAVRRFARKFLGLKKAG